VRAWAAAALASIACAHPASAVVSPPSAPAAPGPEVPRYDGAALVLVAPDSRDFDGLITGERVEPVEWTAEQLEHVLEKRP
jgi:hypothetical protein